MVVADGQDGAPTRADGAMVKGAQAILGLAFCLRGWASGFRWREVRLASGHEHDFRAQRVLGAALHALGFVKDFVLEEQGATCFGDRHPLQFGKERLPAFKIVVEINHKRQFAFDAAVQNDGCIPVQTVALALGVAVASQPIICADHRTSLEMFVAPRCGLAQRAASRMLGPTT